MRLRHKLRPPSFACCTVALRKKLLALLLLERAAVLALGCTLFRLRKKLQKSRFAQPLYLREAALSNPTNVRSAQPPSFASLHWANKQAFPHKLPGKGHKDLTPCTSLALEGLFNRLRKRRHTDQCEYMNTTLTQTYGVQTCYRNSITTSRMILHIT